MHSLSRSKIWLHSVSPDGEPSGYSLPSPLKRAEIAVFRRLGYLSPQIRSQTWRRRWIEIMGLLKLSAVGIIDGERRLWAELGSTCLKLGYANEAYEAFQTSINLLDYIRGSTSIFEDPSRMLERGLPVYQGIVEACLRLHRDAEALIRRTGEIRPAYAAPHSARHSA